MWCFVISFGDLHGLVELIGVFVKSGRCTGLGSQKSALMGLVRSCPELRGPGFGCGHCLELLG